MRDSGVAQRLAAVDAVRGLAALAVVLFHVPAAVRDAAGIPRLLNAAFDAGYLGVDAFFVLSGFVISLSVAHGEWTPRYLVRFLARRSVRLDPAYWAVIALEPLLGWIGFRFLGDQYTLPTLGGVLAHLVYLQDFLGLGQISAVFWTLCFEVQFYLLLVGTLVLTTQLERRTGLSRRGVLAATLLTLVGYSLLMRAGLAPKPLTGLMLERSYQFGLGIIAWLCASGRLAPRHALPLLGGIVVARAAAGSVLEALVIGGTTGVCWLSVRSARLNQWADARPLQFLGRISYSLYLFHGVVLGRGATVWLMLVAGSPQLRALALLGLVLLLAGSVLFAFVMYRLIEVPTLRLSRRIRLDRAVLAPTAVPVPV
ncbi:MAG: acyltransferase family protein [Gemmatimonas sp.]|uniref:acyltransferase family protein n=1 Tax=Gemmatimonas sp. TaxID=1962908 RepID=UPI00391F5DFC|nr:acyltransferase [Gemmatimonadota bacterium]